MNESRQKSRKREACGMIFDAPFNEPPGPVVPGYRMWSSVRTTCTLPRGHKGEHSREALGA